jgi:hypothetical protein
MHDASEHWHTTEMARRQLSIGDEARLLFLCAGPRGNDEEIARLAGGALQWGVVTRLAYGARAVPVIARRVRQATGGKLPPAAARLGRLAMVEEFELQRMEERLDETVAAFADAGLQIVLLKGAALARSVFASVTDRPMLDLDVLVPADQTDAARATAASVGWVWKHDRRYAPFFSTHHHLPPLHDSRGTRALLELHTGLFPAGHPFQLEATTVAGRAIRARGGKHEALIPSAEDHLVYLCVHWVWSHMMNGGAWRALRDVGALAERGGLDWTRCVTRAREANATTCVYWTLRLAHRLAGVDVPAEAMRAMEPPTSPLLLNRLERYFVWQLAEGQARGPVRLANMLWSAALRPRWSGHGPARPWKNPELSIWVADRPTARPSAARRLIESLGVARVFVGM